MRASARDEWRAMALLVLSGPSTMAEISRELGLGYTLGPRVLKPFMDVGAVVEETSAYRIDMDYLPIVLYFLRELLGLDILEDSI